MIRLHDYQKRALDHVLSQERTGLGLEMGLGKTLIMLSAIKRAKPKRVFVLAPKRVIEQVWSAEIEKWGLDLTYSPLMGTQAQRLKALRKRARIYGVSYDNVRWLIKTGEFTGDWLVIDESHMLKDPSTLRYKALKTHLRTKTGNFPRITLLTGTPIPNSLLDIWSQQYLLDDGHTLGRTFRAFKDRWFYPDHFGYNWKPRRASEQEIFELISDRWLTMKSKDHLALPELIENDVKARLWPISRAIYRRARADMVIEVEENPEIIKTAAVLSQKMLQICSGFIYGEDGRVENVHDIKLNMLDEIAQGTDDNLLVAVSYKEDVRRITAKFPDARRVDNQASIDLWNRGLVKMLLINPASGATGLNLQAGGHTVVWYTPTWNLGHYQQLNARLHRQGQENTVIVHRLVITDSIEEKVLDVIAGKSTMQDAFMEHLK
jgi:SNF2 family DNA or RNA helicase